MTKLNYLRVAAYSLLFLLWQSPAFGSTQDNVYALGYDIENIYLVNTANGTVTTVYANYPGTGGATLAQRASDGFLFYTEDINNGNTYRWDPANPGTAPVLLGSTGVPSLQRFTFAPNGTLYGMDSNSRLYTISTTTGAATLVATFTGDPGAGGDMLFAPDGTLYVIAGTSLCTASVAGGAENCLGTITGMGGGTVSGATFDHDGRLLICDQNTPSKLYALNTTSFVATAIGTTLTARQGDMASVPRVNIKGKVFEDPNFPGGAGRSFASATGASGRQTTRVEIFDSTGSFVTSTLTDTNGDYTLTGAAGKTYTVRVVDSTVTSSRGGAALVPIQTFRTSGLTSNVGIADTSRVGGETPTLADAGNGSTTLAALTTASTTAESIVSLALTTSAATAVDFGFNFNTIVNTNGTGQGSLRQFILNSNGMAGADTSIFMISDGNAHPGLRAGLTNQLSGNGVAIITPATALPAITGANTILDASTEAANIGNTNASVLGAGGTVGVDTLSLSQVNGPEVQIVGSSAIGIGLDINAASVTVLGFSIYGFGNAPNTNGNANIQIETAASGTLITKNVLGTTAISFSDPGGSRSNADNIRSVGGDTGTIQNNLIGFANGKGIGLENGSNGWTVQNNEIRGNGLNNNSGLGGIDVESSATATVSGNLLAANQGPGIDMHLSTGSNIISDNTVTGNGVGTAASLVDMGIRLYGASNTVSKNVINANIGDGIAVTSAVTASTITLNSIYQNGSGGKGIGIDLLTPSDNISVGTSPYVTLNVTGSTNRGGNGTLNFPVITTATIFTGQLTLKGFARPNSIIEFYVSDAAAGNFGQGKTYLISETEGSGQDQDATTGSYSGLINGVNQGADTTNRFTFVIPVPAGIGAGTVLTATATLSGATSEFDGNVAIILGAMTVSGAVYEDLNHNASSDNGESWSTGSAVFINLVQGGAVVQSQSVPIGAGSFLFSGIGAGAYTLVLTNSAINAAAVTPAGWKPINPSSGALAITAIAAPLINQNFGLFHGSKLDGIVFTDTGSGGGTANDGTQNGGESGIGNTLLKATDSTGATIYDSMSTDGAGRYTLWITAAATTVKIVETNPSNNVSTGGSPGSTGGAYTRSTDTVTFTASGGLSYTGVNFAEVPQNNFNTDGTNSALPGTAVYYPHSFTSGTGGQVTFSTTHVSSPSGAGFNEVIYQDTNCNGQIDGGEPVLPGAVVLVANQQICILVKEFVPAGTPANAQDNVTVSAQFSYSNAVPVLSASYTHSDLTTVGAPTSAGLRLQKAVDKATALPGDTITYTITFINESSAALTSVIIDDGTPAYTTFLAAACGALPSGITGCSIIQPGIGASGNVTWTLAGALASGASSFVTFQVRLIP